MVTRRPVDVCLAMIVRDESRTIRRCLASVKRHVSGYVIVDTGSTDDTVPIIQAEMRRLSGSVIRESWSGRFDAHRNTALSAVGQLTAKLRDPWLLTIDADETLLGNLGDAIKRLAPRYDVIHCYAADLEYRFRKLLAARVRSTRRWVSPIHEYLETDPSARAITVEPSVLCLRYGQDGYRRRHGATWLADRDSLIRMGPQDVRSAWLLARTYESAGRLTEAAKIFAEVKDRADDQDMRFQAAWGELRTRWATPDDDAKCARIAHEMTQMTSASRAEPLCVLAAIAVRQRRLDEAEILCDGARQCDLPVGTLMYDAGANAWKPDMLSAAAAFVRGEFQRAAALADRALDARSVPAPQRRKLRRLRERALLARG